jgi:hypothetical protein
LRKLEQEMGAERFTHLDRPGRFNRIYSDPRPQAGGDAAAGFGRTAGRGGWRVGPDHLDRAARFEEMNRLQRPVRMTVLSWQNLEALPGAVGATWLDRQLVAKAPETIAPMGMGSEVGSALQARRQWLLDQGLAREEGGRIAYARNLLQTLELRELAEVGARIASETGLGYAEIKQGDRLNGTYRRRLNSGRFALIERALHFVSSP